MTGEKLFAYTLEKLECSHLTRTIPRRLRSAPDFDPAFGARVCELTYQVVGSDMGAYDQSVADLVQLSSEFLESQMFLEQHGHYRYTTFAELQQHVYGQQAIMSRRYYTGLLLSQAFWINHYRMIRFFIEQFGSGLSGQGEAMEVPVGTGIYLSEFVRGNPRWRGHGVDLSGSALKFAERVCRANGAHQVEFLRNDIFEFTPDRKFDRVICGELLEHVEHPDELLRRLGGLVRPDGLVFLTTAVWAGAIDHIYLFESVDQVRTLVEAVFRIEKELCLNVFEHRRAEEPRTPVNYACVASLK